MASKFRATYTYTDPKGEQHTIRLSGQNKRDTDLRFQEFLQQPTLPVKSTVKTLKQFILEDYRPAFTTNLIPTTLKTYTFFEIAKEMGLINDTPVKNKLLKNNGDKSGHHKAMLPAEYAEVRKKALTLSNPRHQMYACLLAYTGMRIEEILGLKWELINLDAGYCFV